MSLFASPRKGVVRDAVYQNPQGRRFRRAGRFAGRSFRLCRDVSPVTYWGLRDYGVPGQIGLEPSLGEHLDVMVRVFREVRRVLKPTGTLWLNYGDCYATSPNGRSAADTKAAGNDDRTFRDKPFSTVGPIYRADGGQVPDNKNPKARAGHSGNRGNTAADHSGRVFAGGVIKPKDLCMVSNRLAIALQDDGWWVRSEIVWHKPNPMPESTNDRPTSSHEKIWLLSKAERYFYDADAIREAVSVPGWDDGSRVYGGVNKHGANAKQQRTTGRVGKPHSKAYGRKTSDNITDLAAKGTSGSGFINSHGGRNARNVWTIPPQPFPEAHFATFPPELVERCLKAGCPKGGHVLDPFGGSGTTALVADGLGMDCTLIELNGAYVEIARKRLSDMFRRVEIAEVCA